MKLLKFIRLLLKIIVTTSPTLVIGAPVKIVTHLEYLEKDSSSMKIYHDEQELVLKYLSMDSFENFRTSTSFQVNNGRSDGRPLMMSISNVFGRIKGEKIPTINLPFSFRTNSIRRNYEYLCTQNFSRKDVCRVQLVDSRVNLGLQTENLACKVKIKSDQPLEFSQSNTSYTDILAFPSIVSKRSIDGEFFEISFDCYNLNSKKTFMKGYFVHNKDQVPALN